MDQNEAMGMELENFSEQNGFSYFSVSTTEITVKFVAADGATIYQYTRSKRKSFQACSCYSYKYASGINCIKVPVGLFSFGWL